MCAPATETAPWFPFGPRTNTSWPTRIRSRTTHNGTCCYQHIFARISKRWSSILLESVSKWLAFPTPTLSFLHQPNLYLKGLGGLLGDDMGLGKRIQVISFLSAIMHKHGDERDLHRRHNHVSELQDERAYRKKGILPKANATWPTCLIIAVSLGAVPTQFTVF